MLIFPRFYLVNRDANSTKTEGVYIHVPDDDWTNTTDVRKYVKNRVFTSIKESLFNMLIFLTASNNPDSKN